jgi:hypothetical protein
MCGKIGSDACLVGLKEMDLWGGDYCKKEMDVWGQLLWKDRSERKC